MELAELTVETFAPLVGDAFTIAAEPAAVELTLESASIISDRPGGRDPFSLILRGPPEPLSQAIHRLEHAGLGALEIFVVPVLCVVRALGGELHRDERLRLRRRPRHGHELLLSRRGVDREQEGLIGVDGRPQRDLHVAGGPSSSTTGA